MKNKILGIIAFVFTCVGVSLPAISADETCWKASYGRRLTLPDRCPPGSVMDAGLCYPLPRDSYTCTGPGCFADCPPDFRGQPADCVKPRKARVYSWMSGEAPGNDAAWLRCSKEWGAGCYKASAVSAEIACPAGWTSTGIECIKGCPSGYADTGLFCLKPSYTRGVGSIPRCGPGQENIAGLCYTPCRDGYTGVGAVCWAGCPKALAGASDSKCTGGLCDCGAMCGTSREECAKTGVGQGFAVLGAALQIAALAVPGAGAAISGVSTAVSIAQMGTNIGFSAATGAEAQRAGSSVNSALNGMSGVASNIGGMNVSTAGGFGLSFIANASSFTSGAIQSGSVDMRAALGLDPSGVGGAIAAFMLPTCPGTEEVPFARVIKAKNTGPATKVLNYIDWGNASRSTTFTVADANEDTPITIRGVTFETRRALLTWVNATSNHMLAGVPHDEGYRVLQFKTWGGANAAAVFSNDGRGFVHVDGHAPAVTSQFIDYLGHDRKMYRVEWSGTRKSVSKRGSGGVYYQSSMTVLDSFHVTELRQVHGPEALWSIPSGMIHADAFNFVGWDDRLWTAKREGNSFKLKQRGTGAEAAATSISYIGWDNNKWTASWEGDQLKHVRELGGLTHVSPMLLTFDWSSSRIAMAWNAQQQRFTIFNPEKNTAGAELARLYLRDSRLAVFDPTFYMQKYPDVARAYHNSREMVAVHWLQTGLKEGRDSKSDFSVRDYLGRYDDLQKAFGTRSYEAALNHWLQKGHAERRDARPAAMLVSAVPSAPPPPALGMALTGKPVQTDGIGAVFIVSSKGVLHGIPNMDVFNNCGLAAVPVTKLSRADFASLPMGQNVSTAQACLQTRIAGKPVVLQGGQTVFLVSEAGRKHPIASPQVFAACGFAGPEIVPLVKGFFDTLPAGDALTTGPACLALRR